MYLLDTNVISELRKAHSRSADRNLVRWASRIDRNAHFMSVISLMELETGVRLLERRDSRQGKVLRTWLVEGVLPAFAGRLLAVDAEVAVRAAALQVPDPRSYRDSLIAATAQVHGFTVVTRNIADFAHMGVPLLNPWLA